MERLTRKWVRLKRFRYRRGFGVHSPFAYDFITNVINETGIYYAYKEVEQEWNDAASARNHKLPKSVKRLGELIFRLVNRAQPQHIMVCGGHPIIPNYIKAAKPTASLHEIVAEDDAISKISLASADFLCVDCAADADKLWSVFNQAANAAQPRSLFVIQNIHSSPSMSACWAKMKEDARVGITFDLYDVGILFFDLSKLKQHYIVNF